MEKKAAPTMPGTPTNGASSFEAEVQAMAAELTQLQRTMRRQQQVDSATLEQVFGI